MHERREEGGNPYRLSARSVDDEDHDLPGEEDEQRERAQRPERMDEVGPAEREASPKCIAHAQLLGDCCRNAQAEEREPHEAGEDEPEQEERGM